MRINGINSNVLSSTSIQKTKSNVKFDKILEENFQNKVKLDLSNEEINYFQKAYPVNSYEVANYKYPYKDIKLGQIIDRKV